MTEQMNNTDDAERIVHLILKENNIFPKEVRAILSKRYPGGFKISIGIDSSLEKDWANKHITNISEAFFKSNYAFAGFSADSYTRSDGSGSLTVTATILSYKQGDNLFNGIEFIEMLYDFLKENKIDSIVIGDTGGLSFRGKDLEINVESKIPGLPFFIIIGIKYASCAPIDINFSTTYGYISGFISSILVSTKISSS